MSGGVQIEYQADDSWETLDYEDWEVRRGLGMKYIAPEAKIETEKGYKDKIEPGSPFRFLDENDEIFFYGEAKSRGRMTREGNLEIIILSIFHKYADEVLNITSVSFLNIDENSKLTMSSPPLSAADVYEDEDVPAAACSFWFRAPDEFEDGDGYPLISLLDPHLWQEGEPRGTPLTAYIIGDESGSPDLFVTGGVYDSYGGVVEDQEWRSIQYSASLTDPDEWNHIYWEIDADIRDLDDDEIHFRMFLNGIQIVDEKSEVPDAAYFEFDAVSFTDNIEIYINDKDNTYMGQEDEKKDHQIDIADFRIFFYESENQFPDSETLQLPCEKQRPLYNFDDEGISYDDDYVFQDESIIGYLFPFDGSDEIVRAYFMGPEERWDDDENDNLEFDGEKNIARLNLAKTPVELVETFLEASRMPEDEYEIFGDIADEKIKSYEDRDVKLKDVLSDITTGTGDVVKIYAQHDNKVDIIIDEYGGYFGGFLSDWREEPFNNQEHDVETESIELGDEDGIINDVVIYSPYLDRKVRKKAPEIISDYSFDKYGVYSKIYSFPWIRTIEQAGEVAENIIKRFAEPAAKLELLFFGKKYTRENLINVKIDYLDPARNIDAEDKIIEIEILKPEGVEVVAGRNSSFGIEEEKRNQKSIPRKEKLE